MKKYKLLTFIITTFLTSILYCAILIPPLIGLSNNNIDLIAIILLILYGFIVLFLPTSFIYYFYAKLYVRHKYDIFAEPLGIFEILFMAIPYTFKFYFTKEWYQLRDEYKKGKNR